MGPEGAVNIVFRKEHADAPDAETRRAELIADYRERFANPYTAAERGYVDEVIEPPRTRPVVGDAVELAALGRVRGERRDAGGRADALVAEVELGDAIEDRSRDLDSAPL